MSLRYTFALPYPPSVNAYWRNVRGRVLVSAAGRAYRKRVRGVVAGTELGDMAGRLGVRITAHPPDRRRRDLDNTLKATLDALQDAGLYEDDGQIDELQVLRGEVVKDGRLDIDIWQIP